MRLEPKDLGRCSLLGEHQASPGAASLHGLLRAQSRDRGMIVVLAQMRENHDLRVGVQFLFDVIRNSQIAEMSRAAHHARL